MARSTTIWGVGKAFAAHLAADGITMIGQLQEMDEATLMRRYGVDRRFGELELLSYLLRQATIPEFQVRLKWQPNTIAFWDNRATQHYAIQDYFPQIRRMMRATIVGTVPA